MIFGTTYRKGLAICRSGNAGSAPMFVPAGVAEYRLPGWPLFQQRELLCMNDNALQNLLGADATVGSFEKTSLEPHRRCQEQTPGV
jgi:hypothetical protein